MTDFPTVTNECYSTSRLPLPSRGVNQQQRMQLSQNQAYVTSANVSMKANESYDSTTTSMDLLYATVEEVSESQAYNGTTTSSMDCDQLYATVEEISESQAYITSSNQTCGTATPSMDSDLLYATVEREHNTSHTSQHDTTATSHTSQQTKEEDYDYIRNIL